MRQRRFALCVVLISMAPGGCDSDEFKLPAQTPEVKYTAPATTRFVSAQRAQDVVRMADDGSTIVLHPDSPLAAEVKEGQVLMFGISSTTPDGLLRKVASKTFSSEGVALTTEEAELEEAFEELDLTMDRNVPYQDLESYDTEIQGLSIHRSPLTFGGDVTGRFEISFDSVVLYDDDGDKSTTDDQIVADGSISFTLGIEFQVKISWFTLKRIKAGASISQDGELKIHSTLVGLKFQKETVLGKMNFAPFFLGPVVIRPKLELILGASGNLKVEVVTSVSEHLGAGAGAIYEGGRWTPYAYTEASWDFQPPTLTASAELKAYLGPRFTLMIYGVAGPYAQVVAYLKIDADTSKTPWWQLLAGIEGSLGIQGKILGKSLFNFRLDGLIDFYVVLAQANDEAPCVPDCTGLQCGSDRNNCGTSCGTCAQGLSCQSGKCLGANSWRDTASGLTWEVTPTAPNPMQAINGIAYCQGLTAEGGGWRLPTIGELRSLIRGCAETMTGGSCPATDSCSTMSCNTASCMGCPPAYGPADGCYWPAEMKGPCASYVSSSDSGPMGHWYVRFDNGGLNLYYPESGHYIRCVK